VTRYGSFFIIAGVLIYLVASQTQVGWLYLLDAVIWSLLIISAFLPRFSLRSLDVEQQVLLPVPSLNQPLLNGPYEDETLEVRLKVSNKGRFAKHFIRLRVNCTFENPEKRKKDFLLTTLNPGSTTVFSYSAECYRRGNYSLSEATFQSGGPLGLIIRRHSIQLPLQLTIYPRFYKIEGLNAMGEDLVDWGQGTKSNAATEFYGSREYQYGDPLKHIHWRNTAKLGSFMLKEFEQAGRGMVSVVFETRHDFGTGRETTLEYSIKIAASLAKVCADYGRSIDIIAGETPLHNAEYRVVMDYLANLEVTDNDISSELMASSWSNHSLVVILPIGETGLAPLISQLVSQGKRMVVVLLQGFTQDEDDSGIPGLTGNNLDIIRCSRGDLESTINKLSGSLLLTDKVPVKAD